MENMTIRQAAESLNLSVDTIRRRIKEGKIRAWKVTGQYGKQWVIDPNSLAEFQQVIEVVPVTYNLDPNVLMDNIRQTVIEATRQETRQVIIEAMQEQTKQIESLTGELQELRKLIEQQEELTFRQKLKGLFNKGVKQENEYK